MPMQFKNWSELNKNAFLSVQQFADLQNTFFKNLTQKQLDMVGLYMESGAKQLRAFSEVKDFSHVFTKQFAVLNEVNQSLLNHYQSILKMIVDLQVDFTKLAEQSYRQSSQLTEEKIKAVLTVADKAVEKSAETVQKTADVITTATANVVAPIVETVTAVEKTIVETVETVVETPVAQAETVTQTSLLIDEKTDTPAVEKTIVETVKTVVETSVAQAETATQTSLLVDEKPETPAAVASPVKKVVSPKARSHAAKSTAKKRPSPSKPV
ncbi:Phasin protein [Beggiatoa alba B18LD]|uniref:Phasin protein n=1 Tax=Beggiatoa alba B18LD TaxID=395493 RepID=I3CDC8_9GAMM|nr:phasin family protein [Beggiatoa alba]EIJ41621.1 Phasin protein [Beggiatoa alba B18LD]